jgi:hypothetical protein
MARKHPRKPRKPRPPTREHLRALAKVLLVYEEDGLDNGNLLYDFCSEHDIPLNAMVAEFLTWVVPITSSAKH